ncbi:MAG: RrF2 family transcriptional regulator [Oscillospiraceae bacterium]|nr:RrF2 family transcriptional regulator [Oscillospiraceae bacterium]MBR6352499.1 RrF2 family transcriptional regulator [Oscillospiraceae bacterium]
MNVTSRGRYALRVMMDLAQHADEGFVSLATLGERQSISTKYLEAIAASLRKAGLVESSRGKEGGYRLARSPADYSVGEILSSVEDSLAPVACMRLDAVACERAEECRTLPMWMELDAITRAYLDSVRLTDLLSGERWKKT